jgi:3-oxoacyl-[acyl-carrier-protein] synthase-3
MTAERGGPVVTSTATLLPPVGLGAFACEFGDRERTPESIEGFAALAAARAPGLSVAAMGCRTFWQMTGPAASYLIRTIATTLCASGVDPRDVDHLVLSTMDKNLRHLDENFARNVLGELGLVNCIPVFVSMQQCVSSLAALDHARRLFADASVNHVIVAALDFVIDDRERLLPFALFGDAAASCLVSRNDALRLLSCGGNVDFAGLQGRDNFDSRKRVVAATFQAALQAADTRLSEVEKIYTTNLFQPIALFNAGICGIRRSQLCIDTLGTRAHCGNCDWMINLIHHRDSDKGGLLAGRKYLVQAFAPGFFACGLLESV